MKKASAANSDHRTTNSSSGWPSPVAAAAKMKKDQIARKVIEKNRRNHMKTLCTHLTSLLPANPSKRRMTVQDKIDEAAKYIRRLKEQLKEANERKGKLVATMEKSASHSCSSPAAASRSPVMEILEMGSTLEVVVLTGLDQRFIMYQVIRILQQETVEVLNANLSVTGNTIFHTVRGKTIEARPGRTRHEAFEGVQKLHVPFGLTSMIEESMYCFRATTIREKLNKLVGFGMAGHDQESDKEAAGSGQKEQEEEEEEQGLWDNEILFGNWDFTFGI